MTEMTVTRRHLPKSIERFVLHWGEMGQLWGVNRSVAQIHALLYVADEPLAAEDIADRLRIARSNVSTSLKELVGWNLVRRVHVMGDRRDFYEAEADMFEMVRRIAEGRKAREIDPTIEVLKRCVEEANDDPKVSPAARRRLETMLDMTASVDKAFTEIMRLPPQTLAALLRMGGAVARLVGPAARRTVRKR